MLRRLVTATQTHSSVHRNFATMKLSNLSNTLGLVSLFCAFTSAGITIGEMPYQVQVGEWYDVEYSSDRNYVSSLLLI